MENAIIMASGLGMRMRPLTENTPKPLLTVGGVPMVETVIQGLFRRNVAKIVVVVGYLGEQFDYLIQKYPNVRIVRNEAYAEVNNISSIYAARDVLDEGDAFICEADLFLRKPEIFDAVLEESCYFAKLVPGESSDWVFDVGADGLITRVGKVGCDAFNMVGVAYFKAAEARLLKSAIEKRWGTPGYEVLFWDDVVNENLDVLKLHVHPIPSEAIVEIDTPEELERIKRGIYSNVFRFCS